MEIETIELVFHSHVNYNPDCDILELPMGESIITYGVYVSGPRKGDEFMEYYSGPNYTAYGGKKSYSRCYSVDRIPKAWRPVWEVLKIVYLGEYLLISNLG
jgi:hypothetical protein